MVILYNHWTISEVSDLQESSIWSNCQTMVPDPNSLNPGQNQEMSKGHPDGSGIDKSSRLEIRYEGFFYDVTNFVARHPGGNIIRFYTEPGEDATQAIQQFHNRSINKVTQMLKSFPKRPANDVDSKFERFPNNLRYIHIGNLRHFLLIPVPIDPVKLSRHHRMTEDFGKLFQEMKAEGLFAPSYWRIAVRFLECFTWWAIALQLITYSNPILVFLGCVCFALGGGRGGWLMHEGGHHSLTGNPKWDRFLQSVVVGQLFTL